MISLRKNHVSGTIVYNVNTNTPCHNCRQDKDTYDNHIALYIHIHESGFNNVKTNKPSGEMVVAPSSTIVTFAFTYIKN